MSNSTSTGILSDSTSSSIISDSSTTEPSDPNNPLHIPFREWELGPNNTIWDNLRAAPSDEDILWQWGLLLGLSVVALVGILIVFLAILSDRKCRQNSFNVYILHLMVPDLLFTTLGIMTTSLNLANGSFFNLTHCHLQSYYSVFTVTASSWLNAILARQLHAMLRASNSHRRYKAPTRQKAMKHGAIVFVWSAFIALWALGPWDWWPIRTELYSGAFCLPMAYDEPSMAFLCLVFGPCCFVLPFLYICYVVIDILYRQLLPPKEKRKRLLIFFGLIITYFFIWVPTIVLTYILGYWMTSWYTYFGAVWGVSQGFISAAVCLLKADIQKACKQFVGWKQNSTSTESSTGRGRGDRGEASESYIHTSIFGLDTNSMHSVASSVVDLASLRDATRRSGDNHSPYRNSGGNTSRYAQSSVTSNSLSGSFQNSFNSGSFLMNPLNHSGSLSTSFQTGGGGYTTGTSGSVGAFESNRSDDLTIFEIDEDLLDDSKREEEDDDDCAGSIANQSGIGLWIGNHDDEKEKDNSGDKQNNKKDPQQQQQQQQQSKREEDDDDDYDDSDCDSFANDSGVGLMGVEDSEDSDKNNMDPQEFGDDDHGGDKNEETIIEKGTNHSQDALSGSFRSITMDGKITCGAASSQDDPIPELQEETEVNLDSICPTLDSDDMDHATTAKNFISSSNQSLTVTAGKVEDEKKQQQHEEEEQDLSAMEEGNRTSVEGMEEKKVDEENVDQR